ncbi:MAG: sugar phosphate isomerase/epimerase [Clostridiales Family XIII bacterium]|jgi:sugar phosphate isomerase/epimerase|nr:sugar phosphate isomerase/epimerase [Clostridiales Family XIII bacterium]
MIGSMRQYMRVGLVYFMAWPFAMSGEGDIERTVRKVCEDDYFDVIELTRINDPALRARVAKLAREAGIVVTYGAQPQLLRNGENVNALDGALRRRAVDRLKACIDEAAELGAEGFAFLAGKYEESTKELSYQALLESTEEICGYAMERGGMPVNVEVFDYDIEKCSLIGPAPLAARYARDMSGKCGNFGLMVDLSHIPQLHESIDDSLRPVAPYIRHAHIGNAVLLQGAPAYGDQHPRFGFPNDENGVAEIASFLRRLIEIGYLRTMRPGIVSFEVKPWGDEDPDMVVANAKRYLNRAWELV